MPNQINLPRTTQLWTEQDRDLFNRLPIYMTKIQVDRIQYYSRWTKLLKNIKWEANMGHTMQGVRKVPSPILRSQVFPQTIQSMPRKDVIEVRETSEQCQLYRHNFDSQLMNFLPSFADFLTNHVEATVDDISEKVMVFVEQFYRTAIFHAAPFVWVCGKASGTELTLTPYWTGATISEAKTTTVLQALTAQVTAGLTLRTIAKLNTVAYTDLGIQPYSGKVMGDGTNGDALKHKYCLVYGTEVHDGFIDDPYLLANKNHNLDIITGPFSGSLFGRFTSMHERHELRIAADGTMPAPETIEENPNAYNRGEPVPNPAWVNAPFGVAFLCGAEGYKSVSVGPPPKEFTSKGMSMKHFTGMNWNGKVDMTQDVLINGLDQNNNVIQMLNERGEFLKLIADITMGILPVQRRNIIPIIYQRTRVGAP